MRTLIYESTIKTKNNIKGPSDGLRHMVEISIREGEKIAECGCDIMVYRDQYSVTEVVAEDLTICSRDRRMPYRRAWDSYSESHMPKGMSGSISLTLRVVKEMFRLLKEEGFDSLWFEATDARRQRTYAKMLKRLGVKMEQSEKNPLFAKILL